jgi:hypothetical protein
MNWQSESGAHGFSGTARQVGHGFLSSESASGTGFQELAKGIFGFSGTQPTRIGVSGTVLGFSGTIFGLLGTTRRVIGDQNCWVFRNQTFGFSGTSDQRNAAKLQANFGNISGVTTRAILTDLLTS